jgi:2-oxoglutarate ferredoxin oxidoreductase subunit gamma
MRQILLAGFGGQGILFAGKFLAYVGLMQGKEVSWLPSYGPEMRGGTANCGVILSEGPIGSPIVSRPDILICMNLPSLDKFEAALAEGGALFYDSSLIARPPARPGAVALPATRLAFERALPGLANMILLGAVVQAADLCDRETLLAAMGKTVSERKKDLFDANLRALALGAEQAAVPR